ncbi:MAG: molybdopterin-dependent oxidoreductase [Treponemataceae bacterium]|nr:molybdopterin-dependent oxidoreductase [Treponemataceae bacterium]
MSDEARTAKASPEKKTKSSADAKNTTARKVKQKAKAGKGKISIDSSASFYSDIRPVDPTEELLYAYIITSPYDSGQFEAVEIENLPADYFLLTADKLPNGNSVKTLSSEIPLLADKSISYKGEPVAVLAGSDKKLVEQLAKSAVIIIKQGTQKTETEQSDVSPELDEQEPKQVNGEKISEETNVKTTENELVEKTEENTHQDSDTSAENMQPPETQTGVSNNTDNKADNDSEVNGNTSEKKEGIIDDIKELITSFEDNLKNTVFNENIQKKLDEKGFVSSPEPIQKSEPHAKEKQEELIFTERKFSYGDYTNNFEKADFQIENTFYPRLHIRTISEPEGAYVEYENGIVSIYTPTLWASHLRKNVSSILSLPEENIRIKRTIVPNSDGNSLWYNTILTCLATAISFLTQKTVLLVAPQELTEYMEKPVSISIHHKTGVQKDGRIVASILDVTLDAGAYCPFAEQITDSLAVTAAGAYTPDSLLVCVKIQKSNCFPAITGTRNIDKLTFFAVESQIQDIALKTGINPIDLRIINTEERQLSNDSSENYPIILDRTKLSALYEKILRMSDFNRKYASYSQNPFTTKSSFSTFPSRGMGLAVAFDGKGYYGSPMGFLKHTLEVTMEKDSSLTIKSPTPVVSIIPIWKQYASDMLNISSEQVHFENDDDKNDSSELPETITGSVYIMTQLLKKCCQGIQKLRFRQPLPISVKKKLTKPKNQSWDQEKFCGTPYYSLSWGAAAAEVEIDPLLYKPKLRGIWITVNAGTILNKKQSEISIRKDISYVLRHIMDGMTLSPEKIYINFIESQDEPKQLGCIIYSILPAAITNAIAHATRNTVHTVPIPIDYIFRGIAGK